MIRVLATPRQLEAEELKRKADEEKKWWLEPRHTLFFAYYFNPKSETFMNLAQSGVKAGFSEEYGNKLLTNMPDWLASKMRIRLNPLVSIAVKNLEELLRLPSMTQAMGAFGPVYEKIGKKKKGKTQPKKAVMVHNVGLLKIKADATEFALERLHRAEYAPKVAEVNNNFNTINVFGNDQRTKIAKRIIGGGSAGGGSSKE